MSRIGKLPISIPAGVTIAQDKEGVVTVKGPKGELSQKVDPSIKVSIEDAQAASDAIEELMGDQPESRREFIVKNALTMDKLDI